MAKELPYFRFTSQEWQNGLISLEDYTLKGLFIDVCAYYWVQNCNVDYNTLKKRFNSNKKELESLVKLKIIKLQKNQRVKISFLDEQLKMLSKARKLKQLAGAKGGKQKSSNAKATLKHSSSYKDKDKDKERKNKEVKEIPYDWRNENLGVDGFQIKKPE